MARRLLIRPVMMMQTVPPARPYRMSADVMEIDIAEVIAKLEDEQTFVLTRKEIAAFSKARRRRRRGVSGLVQWLFGR
jgi:hypothetical protein